MPLTFAYGSNMDVAATAARCPRARLLGRARLPKFRFALLPDGFATLARDAKAITHGVLWELSFGDLAALDRYEGVAQGAYEKVHLPVLRETGGQPAPNGAGALGSISVRALVYIGCPSVSLGRAPADYMEKIIACAKGHDFPRDYIDLLRGCAGLPPEDPPKYRAIKNETIR